MQDESSDRLEPLEVRVSLSCILCPWLFLPIYFLFIIEDISFLEKERKGGREKGRQQEGVEGKREKEGKREEERKEEAEEGREGGRRRGRWMEGEREVRREEERKVKFRFNQLQK